MNEVQAERCHQPFSNNIIGIVLAAGIGKRMGCTKQLLRCAGQTLLERVVASAEASNLSRVVVVLGYNAKKILDQITFYRASFVMNPHFRKGQSSSVISGLLEAGDDFEAAMFIPADQPLLTKGIMNKLIEAYLIAKDKSIIVPVYKTSRGNPIIFARGFFSDLMLLVGDIGGRLLISQYRDNVTEVPIDSDAVLFDIDTYDDYKAFLSWSSNNLDSIIKLPEFD